MVKPYGASASATVADINRFESLDNILRIFGFTAGLNQLKGASASTTTNNICPKKQAFINIKNMVGLN